jgi:hypothetical protein
MQRANGFLVEVSRESGPIRLANFTGKHYDARRWNEMKK